MPFYVAAWNFFANNKVAQWVAGIGLAIALFWFWLIQHDAKVREIQELRAEKRARAAKNKAIEEIKEQADEQADRAERAADSVPDGDLHSGVLPDSIADGLFRD